jgi:hypothetical protein
VAVAGWLAILLPPLIFTIGACNVPPAPLVMLKKVMMKYLGLLLMLGMVCAGCNKNYDLSKNKVEIYLLESFSTALNPASPYALSITDARLEKKPLVANDDIEYYEQAHYLFKLRKNIKPLIKDFSRDRGFAVTVNNETVYYGVFHPAFLSSLTFGVATIDPFGLTTESSVTVQYLNYDNNVQLAQLDKRNDPRILDALSATGRLR